jgi:PAS domain S-box-containing protein
VKNVGNAKLFKPAHRIPLAGFLCFTQSMILVLDSDFCILQVNDLFLDHFSLDKEHLIGLNLGLSDIPLLSSKETLSAIEATKTERIRSDLTYQRDGEALYYTMDVIQTTFEDGESGITVVLDDVTKQKRGRLPFGRAKRSSVLLWRI